MPYAKTSLRKEKRDLRERMRSMGLGYGEIAAEFARRYRLRPRAAWREAYGWSLQDAAGRINAYRGNVGLDPGGFAAMTAAHLCEHENWPGHGPEPAGRRPTPYLLALLAAVYDCAVTDLVDLSDRERFPPADLLILDKYGHRNDAARHRAQEPLQQRPPQYVPSANLLTQSKLGAPPLIPGTGMEQVSAAADTVRVLLPSEDRGALAAAPEWPVWFGVRLAHMITLIENWQLTRDQLDSLQLLLHQEILMFDATMPEDKCPIDAPHVLSRRQTLVTLAALPLTLVASSTTSAENVSPMAAADIFLTRCAASITACWHLLRGSDLSAIDQLLSAYILALEGIAQQQSKYQRAAARLASQAHRICGIVALHRNQLRMREHHCKRALYYATVAADASSHASALISLASTYFYTSDPAQAAVVYEQAAGLGAEISVLQRSRVHAELSVVYGQLRREQDAIRSAEIAAELYPDHPEHDRSFLYAEFTPASLTLELGLSCIALAEQYPGHGYERRAADTFARIDQPASAVPDRIRFEIVNHQAKTAVLLKDLDAFETYMNRGLDGVVLLKSRQRQREMQAALRYAARAWPRDQRLKALTEGLKVVATTENSGSIT